MKFKTIVAAVTALTLTVSVFGTTVLAAPETQSSEVRSAVPVNIKEINGSGIVDVQSTAAPNETVTLTATADDGYVCYSMSVHAVNSDGSISDLVSDHPYLQSKSLLFTVPEDCASISVQALFGSFGPRSYYILHSYQTGKGNISIDKSGELNEGESITVTAVPNSGYKLDKILLQYYNGNLITAGQPKYSKADTISGQTNQTEYTFAMPGNDLDIFVYFVEEPAAVAAPSVSENSEPDESEPESSKPVESEPESIQPDESNVDVTNPSTGAALALMPAVLIGGAAVAANIKRRK